MAALIVRGFFSGFSNFHEGRRVEGAGFMGAQRNQSILGSALSITSCRSSDKSLRLAEPLSPHL